jgi:peptidoglycan/LPS O-acetylase OafA/YrhL
METKRMASTESERPQHRTDELGPEAARRIAFERVGLTAGWKRFPWPWTAAAASALVLIAAAFVVPVEAQVGNVLYALAFCGVALVAVILLMTSLPSRRGSDERLRSSP